MKVAFAVIALVACSKSPAPPKRTWIDLDPLLVSIEVPAGATMSQNTPGEIMVSARECIVLVSADPGGPLAQPEYVPAEPAGKQSFVYRATVAGATYKCEPFVPRADVACELHACRSMRPRDITGPVGP